MAIVCQRLSKKLECHSNPRRHCQRTKTAEGILEKFPENIPPEKYQRPARFEEGVLIP